MGFEHKVSTVADGERWVGFRLEKCRRTLWITSNKAWGYKHKFSIIRLELLWQRGYEDVFSSIPHKPPPWRRGTSKFEFFKQKLWVTSKKFLNFVCNHSGKGAMRKFFHLYHINTPLERSMKFAFFLNKVGGYKHTMSKFVWNHAGKEAIWLFFYLYHKNHPLEKWEHEVCIV